MRKSLILLLVVGLMFGSLGTATASTESEPSSPPVLLDPNLPVYHPVDQLQGELKLGGSNTLSHVAAVWIDSFRQFYPDVKTSIDIIGSRQAVVSVKSGQSHVGLLSRTINQQEVDDFRKQFGYPPTVLTPCLERTAIYVHRDNPIEGITLSEVDAMFSAEGRRGAEQPCRQWDQLGLTGRWANLPVVVHGRSKDTGSQIFIQQMVLLGGPLRADLQTHRTNLDMLRAVAADPGAVGFAGLSYATADVRPVPLARAEGDKFVAIDSPEADQGRYPLVRRLQLVVNHDSKKQLRPVEREFIKYVFSRLGQEDVIKAGFQAIPARPARVALDAVGLGVVR